MLKWLYMLSFIDNFLNKTTMYRVVLYVLSFLFLSSIVLSFFDFLPHSVPELVISFLVILIISYISNFTFSYIYKAPTNVESVYITAFILFFLIPPIQNGEYSQFLTLAITASILAVASKYILTIKGVHIFNPVAISLVVIAFTIGYAPSWWISAPQMLPFVILGGLFIARKIRRNELFISFGLSTLATIIFLSLWRSLEVEEILNNFVLLIKNSPFFFFGFVMLTEPLTAPTTKWRRVAFGILVGILSTPSFQLGSFYFTSELALVVGNIFGYIINPKEKLFLKLKEKKEVATDTFDFIFENKQKFDFKSGQYMEWTFAHKSPDSRGVRRYFTIASSPTEKDIRLGVKFYPKENKQSSFKEHMLSLPIGSQLIASQKSGDFVLPEDKTKELVLIAGGIGITPFRSMLKYLLDKKERRSITLLYSNKKISDIAYKDILDQAESELGIKTFYAITDKGEVPMGIALGTNMYNGFIDSEIIKKEVPDFINKTFFISGPHAMVNAFHNTLKSMGVPRKNIKIDFFPGFV